MEESAALARLYRVITKLSGQAPSSHRGDAHKLEFLLNAVVGAVWSHEILSRVATHNFSFQQLHGELDAALQLQTEAQQAALRDSATISKKLDYEEEVPGILFARRTRLANHPSSIKFRIPPGSAGGKNGASFDPPSISGCFNCEDPNHLMRDCPKTRNIA